MTKHSAAAEDPPWDHFRLRSRILSILYERFKAFPYAAMELREIEDLCATDAQTLNWNMVYLEKAGYVELGKSLEMPPYVACSATISAIGIDLVEDPYELRQRFPEQGDDCHRR